jgi:hypothetical protein
MPNGFSHFEQIRQRIVEQLILPLGSKTVHEEAPYVNKALFYGTWIRREYRPLL